MTTGAPPPIATLPTLIWTSDAIPRRVAGLIPQPADVVRQADEEEEQHDRDADDRDALVDFAGDCFPADALNERERDVSAVERQQWQQVQERERKADQAEHPEKRVRSLLDGIGGPLHEPDRTRDVLAPLTGHEPADTGANLLRDPPGVAD